MRTVTFTDKLPAEFVDIVDGQAVIAVNHPSGQEIYFYEDLDKIIQSGYKLYDQFVLEQTTVYRDYHFSDNNIKQPD